MGCQWGDEGKGKIVDVLAAESHLVARYQGGGNAGHTVIIGDKKFVFHLLPSGVLHDGVKNLVGNGVVVDITTLLEEVDMLRRDGIEIEDRLFIAEHAHIITPLHKAIDQAMERVRGKGKIGTTGRGIGTAYADKARRMGLRVCDLRSPDVLVAKYRKLADYHGAILSRVFGADPPAVEESLEELLALSKRITPMIVDSVSLVNDALAAGREVLAEGAQGVMLDIDHGTYPYVTSSSPTPGGACVGLGVAPTQIKRVIGIVKAYTTRVGEGPMPTELHGEEGERLRAAGGEFGATTGRPRRCGWLDLPVLRRSIQITGCTELVITKLDVLDEYSEISICTDYDVPGVGRTPVMPFDLERTKVARPIYESVPGWNAKSCDVTDPAQLPEKAHAYLRRIESELGVRVSMVSTGPARAATVPLGAG